MTLANTPVRLSVLDAVTKRRSVRNFLPTPVPLPTVMAILEAAARAPSGTNIQPWMIHVVTGGMRQRLSAAAAAAADAGKRSDEYTYIPPQLKEPYLSRRRKLAYDLFKLYGIDSKDREARKAAMLRNFDFFGAPIGLFFTMERCLELGSWLDCGMFMQNVMILAREFGLETCPQQSWCEYGGVVHEILGIPSDYIVLSGMAIGYENPAAPENQLRSDREPLSEYVRIHGA